MINIPEFVRQLQPYKAGKPIGELAREKQLSRIVKLASNENPLGPSPKAMAAISAGLDEIHRYTDPAGFDMVHAFANKYEVQPQHVICGHGTDSLLADMISAFTEEADEIVTSEGTFIGIYVSARKLGRGLKLVPMKNYGYDLNAILDAISPKTKIVYLANPNNPTGTMFVRSEFEQFMAKVPQHILVILDEAYTTYAKENPDYPNGVRYEYDNMLVARTLSKAYGLAGIRVGFAIGPKYLIDALRKVRLPFEPNYLAQLASVAALDDDEFLNRTIETNRRSLKMFEEAFDTIGLPYVKTSANFILMLLPTETAASCFFEESLNRGLILRHVKGFGIPTGVRINSGTDDETRFAIKVIEEVYPLVTSPESKTSS